MVQYLHVFNLFTKVFTSIIYSHIQKKIQIGKENGLIIFHNSYWKSIENRKNYLDEIAKRNKQLRFFKSFLLIES